MSIPVRRDEHGADECRAHPPAPRSTSGTRTSSGFFEQYEHEAALRAHNESEHFREFEERLPTLLDGEPEGVRFEVSDATELEV